MNQEINNQLSSRTVGLDVYLTRHCNLKCKGCYFFSNLAGNNEPECFYPLEDYTRDLLHLKKMNVQIINFCFIGGEVLLIPNLVEYVKKTREIFDDAGMTIFTNGVCFDKLSDQDLDTIHECNCGIVYTWYKQYMSRYIDTLDRLDEHQVYHVSIGDLDDVTKLDPPIKAEMVKPILLEDSEIDDIEATAKYNHANCEHDLLSLCNGKIYTCGKCINIELFNKKFNKNYTTSDALVVADITSNDDVVEFSRKANRLCANCLWGKGTEDLPTIPWSRDPADESDYRL